MRTISNISCTAFSRPSQDCASKLTPNDTSEPLKGPCGQILGLDGSSVTTGALLAAAATANSLHDDSLRAAYTLAICQVAVWSKDEVCSQSEVVICSTRVSCTTCCTDSHCGVVLNSIACQLLKVPCHLENSQEF